MHRWVWDLHHPPPLAARHDYPIAAIPGDTPRLPLGPTALPGHYTVRLTVDGKTYAAPLTVKMDPRVKATSASLERKFDAEVKLSRLMTQLSQAILQAGSIREQLQKLEGQTTGAARDSVQAFVKKLATILGGPSGFLAPPSEELTLAQVSGRVTTLYGQIWQVDSPPTAAQAEAVAATERNGAAITKQWDALKSSDLPALNRELRAIQLPEVEPEADTQKEDVSQDEE